MNTKQLKIMAEFLGWDIHENHFHLPEENDKNCLLAIIDFNPHERTGRHWLVDILEKMTPFQYKTYVYKMSLVYPMDSNITLEQWIQTAPSEICCNAILEVIEGE